MLVYGAGALGTSAIAILAELYPDVEVMAVARFETQRALAEQLGARTVRPEPRDALIETIAAWSGGVLQPADGLPMAFPGGIDVVYDTIGAAETLEVGARVLRARGTLVKLGMHGPARWEDTPVYFKEITFTGSNAFGFEEVDGVRKHGIACYLDLVEAGPDRPHRDAHAHVPARGVEGRVRGARGPGDLGGDQGGDRPALRCGGRGSAPARCTQSSGVRRRGRDTAIRSDMQRGPSLRSVGAELARWRHPGLDAWSASRAATCGHGCLGATVGVRGGEAGGWRWRRIS